MKRSIRLNVYGNWIGYVGRERMYDFGDCQAYAEHWVITGELDKNAAF